ncbi:hypothetical protein [Nitrosomonas nitrosa]|uniref:hypothetical protein n=1 Tax=Nitrosomonas nitrosa TaxID=52442 RepID=UPI0023F68E7F|nr:hypothetical protein [Nitrosomonas nitrosa]MCO6435111.1 hypothetical protein [Nitrosomonas nitrosa]
MNTANNLTINKLRLNNAAENSPALRVRLGRWMESLQINPTNIPPSAVLIVRQLMDPLPKQLNLSVSTARIDSTWERAVQNKLSDICQQAVRPKLGAVPANAIAVVFTDEAEMLACLTLDLVRGEASNHWWWRTCLRRMPYAASEHVTRLWCDRPRLVPSILHHLVERRQAEIVMADLSSEQVFRILSVMNRVYAIPELSQGRHTGPSPLFAESGTVDNVPLSGANHFYDDQARQERATTVTSFTPGDRLDTAMPWDSWLTSGLVPAHLPREKAYLLGVGLTLHQAPAAVRSEVFLQKLHQWWLTSSSSFSATDAFAVSSLPSGREGKKPLATASISKQEPPKASFNQLSHDTSKIVEQDITELTTKKAATPQVSHGEKLIATKGAPSDAAVSPSDSQTSFPKAGLDLEKTNIHRPLSSEPSLFDEKVSSDGHAMSPTVSTSLPKRPQNTSSLESDLSDTEHRLNQKEGSLFFEGGVDTQLGGVLYLINLMAQLDLPQCFEKEWGLASQLGAWGTLDILARALLDEPDESLCQDPLWLALAELDGREYDVLPGCGFQGGAHFYLPVDWPKFVSDDASATFVWGTNRHRHCLWSDQGYMLAEDADTDSTPMLRHFFNDAPVRLTQQPYPMAPIAKLANPLLTSLNPELKRWLAYVVPFIRLRLQLALRGAMDPKTLLLYPGTIYLTSTHVDLVMSLNSVSIPVRMAGLDLDPGWMPDFGRIVLFHYE